MRVIPAWAATIAVILLTAQAALAGEVFPKVLVAPPPMVPYVKALVGDAGEVESLLRAGQDAHDFALSPSQAEMLASADVLVVPDLGMNPLLATLAAKYPKLKIIELSALEGAEPLPYPKDNPWLEKLKKSVKKAEEPEKKEATKEAVDDHADIHDEGDDEHDHEEHAHGKAPLNDPHLWLDPERMAVIASPLATALGKSMPEATATLNTNGKKLSAHLRKEVTPILKQELAYAAQNSLHGESKTIPFITYHAAYQYFLKRFELMRYGEILLKPEGTTGAKKKTVLLSSAKDVKIRCIIAEQESPMLRRMAESSGARIVIFSPEQLPKNQPIDAPDTFNDYDRFLLATVKVFAKCL